MKLITIECRQFNEWDEVTQSTILTKHRDINLSHNWWENIYYDADIIGIKLDGFDLDRNKHCNGKFIHSACEVATNIISEHGDDCQTKKIALQFMNEWQPIFDSYMDSESENYESKDSEDKLMDIESEFLNDILNEYSNILQREYEYLYSDEAIIDTLICNQYEFDNEGNIR